MAEKQKAKPFEVGDIVWMPTQKKVVKITEIGGYRNLIINEVEVVNTGQKIRNLPAYASNGCNFNDDNPAYPEGSTSNPYLYVKL